MSLILNIDTTSDTALVNIAKDGNVLFEELNDIQKDHASFLHPAILAVLKKAEVNISEIDAVAVSHGPGSYTGIRVGVAAAKGLCYAAGKPLITINQLQLLTNDVILNTTKNNGVFCPMVDARRMEVFTALYNGNGKELMPPCAMVLQYDTFQDVLEAGNVYFFGSGALKWQQVCSHKNARYINILNKGLAFAQYSFEMLQQQHFDNIVTLKPLYIKDFHSGQI